MKTKAIKTKKGDLALTKLALMILAAVFLIVAIKIIIDSKTKGISVIDTIRDLFIFGI